jgi:hypothetical protein
MSGQSNCLQADSMCVIPPVLPERKHLKRHLASRDYSQIL